MVARSANAGSPGLDGRGRRDFGKKLVTGEQPAFCFGDEHEVARRVSWSEEYRQAAGIGTVFQGELREERLIAQARRPAVLSTHRRVAIAVCRALSPIAPCREPGEHFVADHAAGAPMEST